MRWTTPGIQWAKATTAGAARCAASDAFERKPWEWGVCWLRLCCGPHVASISPAFTASRHEPKSPRSRRILRQVLPASITRRTEDMSIIYKTANYVHFTRAGEFTLFYLGFGTILRILRRSSLNHSYGYGLADDHQPALPNRPKIPDPGDGCGLSLEKKNISPYSALTFAPLLSVSLISATTSI